PRRGDRRSPGRRLRRHRATAPAAARRVATTRVDCPGPPQYGSRLMPRRPRIPLLGLAIVGIALLLGKLVRSQLGMEFSPSGIQQGVARLGWYGPLVFFA